MTPGNLTSTTNLFETFHSSMIYCNKSSLFKKLKLSCYVIISNISNFLVMSTLKHLLGEKPNGGQLIELTGDNLVLSGKICFKMSFSAIMPLKIELICFFPMYQWLFDESRRLLWCLTMKLVDIIQEGNYHVINVFYLLPFFLAILDYNLV